MREVLLFFHRTLLCVYPGHHLVALIQQANSKTNHSLAVGDGLFRVVMRFAAFRAFPCTSPWSVLWSERATAVSLLSLYIGLVLVPSRFCACQDKAFEVLDGDQLQPYMDAIELEGSAAQPMDEGGVEEEKASCCAASWKLKHCAGRGQPRARLKPAL